MKKRQKKPRSISVQKHWHLFNANYGLADKERAGNRGLFGLHGI
ncbi:hypothetical protein [Wolbachia endosymbiont of Madathamugadia hiepei]|nr:hypothetical protein [Wolbachia endosymbiont of Madathamugadia hiepei]